MFIEKKPDTYSWYTVLASSLLNDLLFESLIYNSSINVKSKIFQNTISHIRNNMKFELKQREIQRLLHEYKNQYKNYSETFLSLYNDVLGDLVDPLTNVMIDEARLHELIKKLEDYFHKEDEDTKQLHKFLLGAYPDAHASFLDTTLAISKQHREYLFRMHQIHYKLSGSTQEYDRDYRNTRLFDDYLNNSQYGLKPFYAQKTPDIMIHEIVDLAKEYSRSHS